MPVRKSNRVYSKEEIETMTPLQRTYLEWNEVSKDLSREDRRRLFVPHPLLNQAEKFYLARTAIHYLGVGRQTFWNAVWANVLPADAQLDGRTLLWKQETLDTYVPRPKGWAGTRHRFKEPEAEPETDPA